MSVRGEALIEVEPELAIVTIPVTGREPQPIDPQPAKQQVSGQVEARFRISRPDLTSLPTSRPS